MQSEKTTTFKLSNLVNPVYLSKRISSIASFQDLSRKVRDLFVLAFKITTFRYGERYWEKKRSEKYRRYAANPGEIKDPMVHCEVGELCFYKKDYANATAAYKRAIEIEPSHEYAHFKLGEIYFLNGEYDKAIKELKKAAEIKPDNTNTHILSARAYTAEKIYDKALEEFNKVLELSEGDKSIEKQVYEERARIYSLQENHELLIKELKSLMSLDPANTSVPLSISLSYKMLGKDMEAQKEFDRALEMLKAERGGIKSIALKEGLKEANKLTSEEEMSKGKTKLSSKVRVITLCLTNRCNLNCKMCWSEKLPSPGMSKKVKEEIVKTFPYLEEIMWAGGEVFLDADFNDMFDEAAKHKVKQTIITNGLLINEELARKLIKNDVRLIFSIDGTTKGVYEEIRRGAKFEVMIEKLNMMNRLREKINPNFKMELNVVVMRSNYHQIKSFVKFAKAHNFSKINYFMVVGNTNNQNIFAPDTDQKVLSLIADSITEAVAECGKLGISCFHDIKKEIFKKYVPGCSGQKEGQELSEDIKRKENTANNLKCVAPWKRLNIDFVGDVRPDAHCLCKNIVGNLNTQSLDEIWNNDLMLDYRQQIVSGNIDKVCTLKQVYKDIPFELIR